MIKATTKVLRNEIEDVNLWLSGNIDDDSFGEVFPIVVELDDGKCISVFAAIDLDDDNQPVLEFSVDGYNEKGETIPVTRKNMGPICKEEIFFMDGEEYRIAVQIIDDEDELQEVAGELEIPGSGKNFSQCIDMLYNLREMYMLCTAVSEHWTNIEQFADNSFDHNLFRKTAKEILNQLNSIESLSFSEAVAALNDKNGAGKNIDTNVRGFGATFFDRESEFGKAMDKMLENCSEEEKSLCEEAGMDICMNRAEKWEANPQFIKALWCAATDELEKIYCGVVNIRKAENRAPRHGLHVILFEDVFPLVFKDYTSAYLFQQNVDESEYSMLYFDSGYWLF